jgi:flagellar basal-body rod modification protein FlgD
MTTPISAVGVTTPTTQSVFAAPATTASASAASALSLDPQAFLQLLVAQLQNQDPSNPLDTQQMMSQTATLSQVQTMGSMSSTLSELVNMQNAQAAVALIGHDVTYTSPAGMPVKGSVTGASLLSGGTQLHLSDGSSVPLSSVIGVGEDAAPSTS